MGEEELKPEISPTNHWDCDDTASIRKRKIFTRLDLISITPESNTSYRPRKWGLPGTETSQLWDVVSLGDWWVLTHGFFQNRGGPPKSSHFNRVFPYKPSILGYPYFSKHPNCSPMMEGILLASGHSRPERRGIYICLCLEVKHRLIRVLFFPTRKSYILWKQPHLPFLS